MKRFMRALTAAVLGGAMLIATAACGSSSASDEASTNPDVINVVSSTNQWGSLAKELGGDYVDVTTIMNNTNVDAHDYEPTASDITKLHNAQVAIVNGAGYDDWASKALASSKADVIDAAELGGKKDGDNPHVWFSAEVRNKTAAAITAAYEKIMPSKKAEFEKLYEQWQGEEEDLERTIADSSLKSDEVTYGATESVAEYLTEDLGMTDKTPTGYKQAVANDAEPSASDLSTFSEDLKNGDMRMLIVNSQEPSDMSDALTLAADNGNVPVIDVTEQMPSKYSKMTDWLKDLVKQMEATQTSTDAK